MKIKYLLYSIAIWNYIGCSNENPSNENKKKYYHDGNLKSEVPIIDGKENGVKKIYYEDGSLRATINKKENKNEGYAIFYHKNGKMAGVEQFKNDIEEGDFVWFNQDGNLKYYTKYRNGSSYLIMQFDGNGNIDMSAPFLTITKKSDTIKLGETYTAHINVNFMLPNFKCQIGYLRYDSASFNKKDTTVLYPLANGTSATFTTTPTSTGNYMYQINAVLTDSLNRRRMIGYNGKIWVE